MTGCAASRTFIDVKFEDVAAMANLRGGFGAMARGLDQRGQCVACSTGTSATRSPPPSANSPASAAKNSASPC